MAAILRSRSAQIRVTAATIICVVASLILVHLTVDATSWSYLRGLSGLSVERTRLAAATCPPVQDLSAIKASLQEDDDGGSATTFPQSGHTIRFPSVDWRSQQWSLGGKCGFVPDSSRNYTKEELEACLSKKRLAYEEKPWKVEDEPCEKRRKIFDVFVYNGEKTLLEIRLNELWDTVDYFVVIESPTSFTGERKDMSFIKDVTDFKGVSSKIIHITCDISTVDVSVVKDPLMRAWPREHASRNCALLALATADDSDLVLTADADEIMRASTMAALKSCSREMSPYMDDPHNFIIAGSIRFISSFRWRDSLFPEEWMKTRFKTVGQLRQLGRHALSEMRFSNNLDANNATMSNAGWHCSWCYFGDESAVVTKLRFWSEQKTTKQNGAFNLTDFKLFVTECTTSKRGGKRCVYYPFPHQVPKYVQSRPDFFLPYYMPNMSDDDSSMTVLDVAEMLA